MIVPFILQISIAVGLTGWLSIRNGQRAVNDVAGQLRREVTDRVDSEVRHSLATADTVNQLAVNALRREGADLRNVRSPEAVYWDHLRSTSVISGLGFASETGDMFAVQRRTKGGEDIYFIEYANGSTGQRWRSNQVNLEQQVVDTSLGDKPVDGRQRVWYKAAVAARGAAWSNIYTSISRSADKTLAINIARPIYDDNQDLVGVSGAIFNLRQISQFLNRLRLSKSGQMFIIERNGELVGTSDGKDPFTVSNDKVERLKALNSSSPLIRAAASHLNQQFVDLSKIKQAQQLEFSIAGKRQFLQVTPLSLGNGIDWLIVAVVPESDFMAQINQNTQDTILLCLLALGFASGISILTSRWISAPISRLGAASRSIADGNLDQTVDAKGIQELEVLGQSFNQMAKQLKGSFEELEARVSQRTAELSVAKEAADAANRTKSEFLASMSHELRTPLNGILGYAQILLRDKTASPKQKDGLGIIQQCGDHLLKLINDVLDLAKIEARKLELDPHDFDFTTFLHSVVDICRVKAEQKEITFTYELLNKLPSAVHADEKRLRQVLLNLLGNAIKFTDRGGVTLKVGVLVDHSTTTKPDTTIKPDIEPGDTGSPPSAATTRIRFQVEDTGVGMTPEQLEKIFTPFEQVGEKHRMVEGTGLGLTITQQIVQLLGSQIQVESTAGQGSTFWFEVDLAEVERVESQNGHSALNVTGYEGERRSLLVVDDRWENRSVLVNLLQPLGFELVEASQGQEGIEQAMMQPPDLIITDIAMPVMDGFEMVRKLRSLPQFQHIPIITSSASVFKMDRQHSQEAGCTDFLPKPIQAEELLEQIGRYLTLSWLYSSDSPTSVASTSVNEPELQWLVPKPEELAALYASARIGDIWAVVEEAQRLQMLHSDYQAFATKILQLAQDMNEQAILKLVKPYAEVRQ
ncbi:MAG TPA: ATP-binding protein [Thermosynechococcaceae cyanobacterium]